MKRKLIIFTGTRADWNGYLRPLASKLKEAQNVEYSIIVSGMHLSPTHGMTVNEIKKDNFKIVAEIPILHEKDTINISRIPLEVAECAKQSAEVLKKEKPDFLIVLGDRYEALAATLAAFYMNIPIAHLHGGDSARAGWDESTRHAISKFASIHFPATKKSAERLEKMGEDAWRIHPVGSTTLDDILSVKLLSKEECYKKINLKQNEPFIILLQHSVSTEPEKAYDQMSASLKAIKKTNIQTIVINPNSDAGFEGILKAINDHKTEKMIGPLFLDRITFLSALKYGVILIGNSSSGMIESSSFKIPVLNLGSRQEDRERGENVLDVPHEEEIIYKAINTALNDKSFRNKLQNSVNPYGDGKACERILNILTTIDLSEKGIKKLIQKKLSY